MTRIGSVLLLATIITRTPLAASAQDDDDEGWAFSGRLEDKRQRERPEHDWYKPLGSSLLLLHHPAKPIEHSCAV